MKLENNEIKMFKTDSGTTLYLPGKLFIELVSKRESNSKKKRFVKETR